MNFGFIIDNRKCIGCHACTVACKAEHDVPIGVNRTWVKYIEKGQFPNTRRLFSVMRCNHCRDAPCVEVCPTAALHTRADGIVDFDNRRCIACKACMQACPYDALYIDPETHTAAKCNYCAHRVEAGLEPSCVVVCPEHAIISGDIDSPNSEIARMLAREQVTARKVEKGTGPKLFYIEGDEVSLNPALAGRHDDYLWSSQSRGVGHNSADGQARWLREDDTSVLVPDGGGPAAVEKAREVLAERRVYGVPREGVAWGWEVAAYVWTKAIAAGAFLVPFLAIVFDFAPVPEGALDIAVATALVFLAATMGLLVIDLGRPGRFLYVLLRPQWRSWLVRGGYALVLFGAAVIAFAIGRRLAWQALTTVGLWSGAVLAVGAAVYTAFLFAQAKGRDFWQTPALVPHMVVHAAVAGAAVFALALPLTEGGMWDLYVTRALLWFLVASSVITFVELAIPHATKDGKTAARIITSGNLRRKFWLGGVGIGLIAPLLLLIVGGAATAPVAGMAALAGIYFIEYVWVRAPQLIPLS